MNTPEFIQQHRADLVEFFNRKKGNLLTEIEQIDAALDYLADINNIGPIPAFSKTNGVELSGVLVNKDIGWKSLILDVLKTTGKPMVSRDICNELLKRPEVSVKGESTAFRSVTSNLSQNSKDGGLFKKHVDEKNRTWYSLAEVPKEDDVKLKEKEPNPWL